MIPLPKVLFGRGFNSPPFHQRKIAPNGRFFRWLVLPRSRRPQPRLAARRGREIFQQKNICDRLPFHYFASATRGFSKAKMECSAKPTKRSKVGDVELFLFLCVTDSLSELFSKIQFARCATP